LNKVEKNAIVKSWETVLQQRSADVAYVHATTESILSFRDIDQRANEYLSQLSAVKKIAGMIFAFQLPNDSSWLAFFLALQKAGAIALPIDASLPAKAVSELLAATGANIYYDGQQYHQLGGRKPKGSSLAVVKTTSGSTGQPKGIFFSDVEMMADARNVCSSMGIGPQDLNYAILEYPHSYALGNLILPLYLYGSAIVQSSSVFPQVIAAEINRWKVTVFPSAPQVLKALAQADVELGLQLRTVISAGSRLDPEVARAFYAKHGRRVHNFYGSSETGGIAYDYDGNLSTAVAAIGRPLKGVRVEQAKSGRFLIESDAVFSYKNPRKGAFMLSDFGVIDSDGYISLKGRSKDMVKIGSRRLNLSEVQRSICGIKGVSNCYIFLDEKTGKLLGGYEGGTTPEDLRAALAAIQPNWRIPARMVRLDELPVTGRGKPDGRKTERAVLEHLRV